VVSTMLPMMYHLDLAMLVYLWEFLGLFTYGVRLIESCKRDK
jgi:hypothetical protein